MAAYDLLDATEAARAIERGQVSTNDPKWLAAYPEFVAAASSEIDDLIGWTIVRPAITNERCTPIGRRIKLAHRPVLSIQSVTEYVGAAGTVLTEDVPGTLGGYMIDKEFGELYRMESGKPAMWAEGRGNVVVSYTAGRVASVDLVDQRIKEACRLTMRHQWQQAKTLGSGTAGLDGNIMGQRTRYVPAAAMALLDGMLEGSIG